MNIKQIFMRWKWMRDYEKSLNQRAAVENELIQMAGGKLPLPDAKKCREMAVKLGVPKQWQ